MDCEVQEGKSFLKRHLTKRKWTENCLSRKLIFLNLWENQILLCASMFYEGACSHVCGAEGKQNDESARMYVSEDESLVKASGLNLEETHDVISELIYTQDRLKQLNVELQHSVEQADEQNTSLRTDNTALSLQLKSLKQAVHDAEKLGDELEDLRRAAAETDVTISTQGNRIRQLERENKALKAQYENINSEMSCVLPEREKNKSKIAKLSNAQQALQQQLEEHRLSLDKNSHDLHEKTKIIEHLESSLEEYTTIVQELKKKNKHLEVQLEEALVFGGPDASEMKQSLSVDGDNPMSIADELGLLPRSCVECSDEEKVHIEPEVEEEKEKEPSLDVTGEKNSLVVVQTKSWWRQSAEKVLKVVQAAGTFCLGFLFSLGVMASMGPVFYHHENGHGYSDILWASAHYLMQPYCTVHHIGMPPV